MSQQPWTGGFVQDALGVDIKTDHYASLLPVEDLVGLALRRNPRRAHLLVSRVLGKHVPSEPGLVMAAGELLGVLVGEALSASPESVPATGPLRQGSPLSCAGTRTATAGGPRCGASGGSWPG